ncbi:MAG: sortase [Frankiaceae bacterium]|nr:sortase [Frankiaceae bacterium]
MTVRTEAPAAAAPSPRGRSAGDVVRLLVQIVGELMITFGIVVLLFAVYELKVTDLRAASTQRGLQNQLDKAWSGAGPVRPNGPDPVVTPVEGQPIAVVHIPKLGADYSRVVVEGVTHEDLKKGPGHYPKTALPGQVGNLVVSGHRTTYGAPFSNIDQLRPGDVVDVQVRFRTYHYRITGTRIVSPDAAEVLLPVPAQPGVAPTQRLLTLTTCNPRFSAAQRMIVSGVLQPGDYTDSSS